LQGREITEPTIRLVNDLVQTNPQWHRTRLSKELCEIWNWKTETGQLKDMSCRLLLGKLSGKGLIQLPAPTRSANNHLRNKTPLPVEHEQIAIHDELDVLSPIKIATPETKEHEALFNFLISQYHYLGYHGTKGKNLKYLAWDSHNRPLACLLFDTAAWKTKHRDAFIGWSATQRQARLQFIANNSRFLILPWVKVPHLASHILGCVVRRISGDWGKKYQHRLLMLETFVEQQRFRGTCYKAANWKYLGETTGRSRNDRYKKLQVPIKDIYVYPLCKKFREQLRNTNS
jgi:hypothetical protein